MAKELPASLVGAARDRYLERLQTRMEFLHDFVSGNEDGWGVEGQELEHIVDLLSCVKAVVAAGEIRQVVERRRQRPHAGGPAQRSGNVIPFPR